MHCKILGSFGIIIKNNKQKKIPECAICFRFGETLKECMADLAKWQKDAVSALVAAIESLSNADVSAVITSYATDVTPAIIRAKVFGHHETGKNELIWNQMMGLNYRRQKKKDLKFYSDHDLYNCEPKTDEEKKKLECDMILPSEYPGTVTGTEEKIYYEYKSLQSSKSYEIKLCT